MKRAIISLIMLACLAGCKEQNSNTNLSGRWLWKAEKNGQLVSLGGFELNDQKGKIFGATKTLITGLKAIPGAGGDKRVSAAIIVYPLEGSKQGNKLNFQIKDNGKTMVNNEAIVSADGLSMHGKSKQTISQQEAKAAGLDKPFVYEYEWIAAKLN